jgi:RimJ/RimL family protein N-acetyltransferase
MNTLNLVSFTMLYKYNILTAQHVAHYRKIRMECLKNYTKNFGTLYEDEVNAASLKFDSILANGHNTDFLYGAFDNETLIGICGYIQERRTKTKHIGEISQMYISPAYSGKGIATELLKLVTNKAFANSETEQIILAVTKSNMAAIKLYQKSGFVQYGVLENYMKHNNEYQSQVFMVLKR